MGVCCYELRIGIVINYNSKGINVDYFVHKYLGNLH